MSSELEAPIRSLHDHGDHHQAATQAIELYGDEVLAFLIATMRDEGAAGEAFSVFCENMWKGLPKFSWQASLRTWLYVIARNAASAYFRNPNHRRGRNVGTSELADVAARVRTRTLTFLRTESKDAIARIRASLEPDEQALLILRIDKRMAWGDIAAVMHAGEADVDLKKAAARIRKRFQLLKERLRERAKAEGLVSSN